MLRLPTTKAKRREHAVQDRMRKAAERALRVKMTTEFQRVGQEAKARRADGYGLPGLIYDHKQRMVGIFRAHYASVLQEFGDRAKKLFGQKSATAKLEIKAKARQPAGQAAYDARMQTFVDKWSAEKVDQVGDATKGRIKDIIADGEKEGWSVDETADEIENDCNEIGPTRAQVIARTETHTASQHASIETAKELGIPLTKQWIATGDQRTRDDHADADLQEQPMDEPFTVGGAELQYPGDPDGPPEETINCRCVVVFNDASASTPAIEEMP